MPLTIVDDFYDDPDEVRNLALSVDYTKVRGNYPGYRSDFISNIDEKFYVKFVNKLLGMFWNSKVENLECEIETHFQYIPGSYGSSGWCHYDGNNTFAGVVYLTPDIPKFLGTAICKQIHKWPEDDKNYEIRNDFYAGKPVDYSKYLEARNFNNSLFETVLNVDNIYNRMLMYDGGVAHKENGFYGTDLKDSRLTQVFFGQLKLSNNTQFPLQRGN